MKSVIALAQAPSNIALVKYMGKSDPALNLPENPSLSMTLNHLCTFAEVERSPLPRGRTVSEFRWIAERPILLDPEDDSRYPPVVPELSDAGRDKVLRHLKRCEEELPRILARPPAPAVVTLRSANCFPPASGIASSASAFAAITLAAAGALLRETDSKKLPQLRKELSQLARPGSGSSCRSFDGPFVLWDHDAVRTIPAAPTFAHFVLLISEEQKQVSSSEAHLRVKTSPLWNGRAFRARERSEQMTRHLAVGNTAAIARLAWSEMWEMHSLFHTAERPFTFFRPGTLEVLEWLAPQIERTSPTPPPIVTLDAGPNVHLIVEEEIADLWDRRLRERFPLLRILRDHQGSGARLLRRSEHS